MVNYANSKIFKIRSHKTNAVYIGSTTQPLSKYIDTMRSKYKKLSHVCGNVSNYWLACFWVLQYNDAYIELVEDYPCRSKRELNKRVGHYIRHTDCVNTKNDGRTRYRIKDQEADRLKAYLERKRRSGNVDGIKKQIINLRSVHYYSEVKERMEEQDWDEIGEWDEEIFSRVGGMRTFVESVASNKTSGCVLSKANKTLCECGVPYKINEWDDHSKSSEHREYIEFMSLDESTVREMVKM